MSSHALIDPTIREIYTPRAFERDDETDDALFYERDRFVQHLDCRALATVEEIIGKLVIEERPRILDLMASFDSHIVDELSPELLIGLGLNRHELERNAALHEAVYQDLNRNPALPFPDAMFDVVLNTVSVDYLTRPFEVFAEVGRVLRPGGLLLVVFSNRMFPEKAVRIWREASETERTWIVEDYFRGSGMFEATSSTVSQGLPRPPGDRWAGRGVPSDPVFAVWAERSGGDPSRRRRPDVVLESAPPWDEAEVERRKAQVARTHRCPYCDARLDKWEVPQTPFTEWDSEYLYVCFNDACPYLLRGWQALGKQGIPGMSYRLMFNPSNERCYPVPVCSLAAMKDGIVKG
jgi:SAM-dependent methyltransferase